MKRQYLKCPYCQKELTISGLTMHVRNKHTDKYEEFKKNFEELKKTAVLRDSAPKDEVPGPEPTKIIEEKPPAPPKTEEKKEPEKKEPEKKKEGDGQSGKGGSFLDEFNTWLDSPEL